MRHCYAGGSEIRTHPSLQTALYALSYSQLLPMITSALKVLLLLTHNGCVINTDTEYPLLTHNGCVIYTDTEYPFPLFFWAKYSVCTVKIYHVTELMFREASDLLKKIASYPQYRL